MKNHANEQTVDIPVHAGVALGSKNFFIAVYDEQKEKFVFRGRVDVEKRNVYRQIYAWLLAFQISHRVKVIVIGISGGGEEECEKLASDLWLKQDIVVINNVLGKESTDSARASAIAKRMAKKFDDHQIVDIEFDALRSVHTSHLARLVDFRKHLRPQYWTLLKELSSGFQEQGRSIVFFSSTPRGGGVALMRHALIRLYRLLSVDARWYVLSSKKDIFQITKKQFHNILQGIADPGEQLTTEGKELYLAWIKHNAEHFEPVFRQASVIVIDDPQPAGLIPHIRKVNPKVKIIYRSHIHIRSDLIAQKGSPQARVWKFLWGFIRHADLFVSHPIKDFIPDTVPKEKVVFMPATTDLFDGLNKPLNGHQMNYYVRQFNQYLAENGQLPLNAKRPYIIQLARFDPSKGIPDVLESYRKLRSMLECAGVNNKAMPQLVIAGHGAIDDPEGVPIHTAIRQLLTMDNYQHLADDVKVARLPGNDQLLNALLRGARVALQLSHREGFEVKVTEALHKGVPVIAYRAGGIPLQIRQGITGFLVPVGNTYRVARHLFQLFTDQHLYEAMSRDAVEMTDQNFFTPVAALKWLFLGTELLNDGKLDGNMRKVNGLLRKRYDIDI